MAVILPYRFDEGMCMPASTIHNIISNFVSVYFVGTDTCNMSYVSTAKYSAILSLQSQLRERM